MSGIRNILVPIDLSESSAAALRYGQMLATVLKSRLQVLYVTESPYLTPGGVELWDFSLPELVKKLEEAAEQQVARFVSDSEQPGLSVELVSRVENPTVEITRYAAETNADLIVIGAHGRSGLGHALLGSVAEKVIRKALCPVQWSRFGRRLSERDPLQILTRAAGASPEDGLHQVEGRGTDPFAVDRRDVGELDANATTGN